MCLGGSEEEEKEEEEEGTGSSGSRGQTRKRDPVRRPRRKLGVQAGPVNSERTGTDPAVTRHSNLCKWGASGVGHGHDP